MQRVFSRPTLLALAGVAVATAAAVALLTAGSASARLPRDFFGIAPQTPLSAADVSRMRRGGVDAVRLPVSWAAIQPSPRSGYRWSSLDADVSLLARSHLEPLPFVAGTPRWLSGRETNLPVSSARQRRAWAAFLGALVDRYGRRGEFWEEHGPGSRDFVPRDPVRRWQIWNEENFFYSTTPASPTRYAKLLKVSRRAVEGADPRAEIVIGGLYGDPRERPPRAMDATSFLDRLYRVRGVRRDFDGVALHPYARDVATLRTLTEALRRVVVRHHDARAGLYITEMGWGSQHDPRRVAFEVGARAQARELRGAYRYLIHERRRLNLKQVYWFSWKDAVHYCSFCDSVGLFRQGARFRPKPAWHAFTAFARGG